MNYNQTIYFSNSTEKVTHMLLKLTKSRVIYFKCVRLVDINDCGLYKKNKMECFM